jgi:uncharacterized membrane protein YgcG
VVGTLLDEQAHTRDILSTLVDLAHRGYMVMEEEQEPGAFGIGVNRTFTFKRTDKPATDLRQFEKRVLDRVFSHDTQMERALDSLKNNFYRVLPAVKNELYDELVQEGLFKRGPDDTRRLWSLLGGGLLGLAGILFAVIFNVMESMNLAALVCLPMAVGVTGLAVLVGGRFMPAKTRQGAEEAAKWDAFREYLRNLDRYEQVEAAANRFDDYLPYAVAFGLERSWMRRFSQLEQVPIPTWYYPTYLGGPYRGGYHPGTPVERGSGMGTSPDFSLDNMSGDLSASLNSMSAGLTSMLDSASQVITSQPQSSGSSGRWSSGGSGWSGGGFSGGGSSGGGSAGFG